ncbi:WD40 repeat domain-containing protein [Candidatus Uabimicrobium amorphum]|uniref:Anaphase-promoting complex subunit 4 WD40 domain-containing protein n=1 Tax=Uabimicrobium amorphum TaxID=2596890 RepID=A0A5S9IPL3_UABAM|nr:WD40 repeat domain-containing protein [Candidatus Uabimicrobium amorphum]BBM85758.1 hypothetical protein UABAM_04136 [Candidatus Uabimicrobium amorphum]
MEHRARITRYSLIASVVAIIILGVTSYFKIMHEKSVAIKNEQIAIEQQHIAETQRENAERLRQEKERDATNIRGHMAQISLRKASDVIQQSPLHNRQYAQMATYAGAAAKFIENIDMEIAQQLQIPIGNIKKQIKSKISTALLEHSLLWKTMGVKNIFRNKGAQICWSVDGKFIATAHNHNIVLWNVHGENLRTWTTTDHIRHIRFSSDGKYLFAAVNQNIKVYDLETTHNDTLSGHDAPINALEFYGELLVSACANGEIHLWDVTARKNIQRIKYSQPITHIAPCRSVEKIAFATRENMGIFDVAKKSFVAIVGDDHIPYTALAFSVDGKFIASASSDNIIKIWDEQLKSVHQNFAGHTATIHQLLFKNNEALLSASDDALIKTWNLTTKSSTSVKHSQPVKRIAIANDLLCAIDNRGHAILWKNSEKVKTGHGFYDGYHNLIFRKNVLFVGKNNKINIYNTHNAKKIHELQTKGHQIDVSSDGKILAIAIEDKIHLWHTSDKKYIGKLTIGQNFHSMNFQPQKNVIAVCIDNDIQLWNLQTQKIQTVVQREQGVQSLHFSNSGGKIIITHGDISIEVWDISQGQSVYNGQSVQSDGTRCLYQFDAESIVEDAVFSADENLVALRTHSGEIHIYKHTAQQWKMCSTVVNKAKSYGEVVFHPQNNEILCTSNNDGIYIFHLQLAAQTPHRIVQFIELENSATYRFAQHGKTLATMTKNDIRLWQVKNSDSTFNGRGVTTSADGRFVAWIQGMNSIIIYDTQTHKKWSLPERHLESVLQLTFQPQTNILASTDAESIIFLHKITDTQVIINETNMIGSYLFFNHDGSRAITLDMHQELVYMWDPRNGKPLYDIEHDDFAANAIFSDDGKHFATDNGYDIFIWFTDTGEQKTTLRGSVKKFLSLNDTVIAYSDYQGNIVHYNLETAKSTKTPQKKTFSYKNSVVSLEDEVLYVNREGKKDAVKKILGKVDYLRCTDEMVFAQKGSVIELIHIDKTKKIVFGKKTSSGFTWNPTIRKWIFHVDERNLLHAMEGFFAQKMMPSLSLQKFSPPLYLWSNGKF